MPEGRYLSAALGISPDAGGQTRAMLLRNRFFVAEAGVRPTMITFGPTKELSRLRESLLDRGMLIDELTTLNIYDHYRNHGWGKDETAGEPAPDLHKYKTAEDFHEDGTPWRVQYQLPRQPNRLVYEYLRDDGTPFLRIPRFRHGSRRTWPTDILQMNQSGQVVGRFASVADWYRRWIRELTEGDERAFVFMDSRRLVPHITPMKAPRIHLIYVMHNVHMTAPRHWKLDRQERLPGHTPSHRHPGRDGDTHTTPAGGHCRAPGEDQQLVLRAEPCGHSSYFDEPTPTRSGPGDHRGWAQEAKATGPRARRLPTSRPGGADRPP